MKISFRVFSPVSWVFFARFVGVSARKKNIKIKNQNKKRRTSPTEHFFSPGSSTRILSEYLNIWIKSLSAWVFSFRRRRIFEVRLKFRPFGRYRYIPYSSQMMQAKRFKMIHYHPPEAIDHAVQYLDVHWPHASARLEPYLQTWSHIIPHDQICKFWKVYHGVFVCICSILFLSFASVHICPLRCPLCCPWTLSGKSTGSHWMSAGHNGALRVQGVVCGSPKPKQRHPFLHWKNFEAIQSLRPGEIICIKTQTHHYENMSLSLYENTCGHVFVWLADRIV